MINCSDCNEMISLYIDDQLDERQRKEFEGHIASCESCGREYNEIVQIVSVLNSIEQEELPVNFEEDLHRKLLEVNDLESNNTEKSSQTEKQKSNLISMPKKGFFRIGASAAAVILIVFLVKGLYVDNGLIKQNNEGTELYAGDSAMSVDPAEGEVNDENRIMAFRADDKQENIDNTVDAADVTCGDYVPAKGIDGTESRENATIAMASVAPELSENRAIQITVPENANLDDFLNILKKYEGIIEENGEYLIPGANYDDFIKNIIEHYGNQNISITEPDVDAKATGPETSHIKIILNFIEN
jgi:hypothetical protein